MTKEITKEEMLKEICDKIGYEYKNHKTLYSEDLIAFNTLYESDIKWVEINRDEREIIFTQDFHSKFIYFYAHKLNTTLSEASSGFWIVIHYLDNPTLYLYNLTK